MVEKERGNTIEIEVRQVKARLDEWRLDLNRLDWMRVELRVDTIC